MIKKYLYKIISPVRKFYWRFAQPVKLGVRAVILNTNNQVLLVQHTYIKGWYLPGGGVDKKETLPVAIKRELEEELGITACRIKTLLGVYTNKYELKTDHIAVFIINELVMQDKKNAEIHEWRFFDLDNFPETISPGSKKRLLEFQGLKEIDFIW